MYELIDYLTKDGCLVFVGAGPSCEVGLPNWAALTERVLEEIRRKNPKDIEEYEILFAQGKFQELLGRAWRKISPDFVLNVCKAALADTNKTGSTYSFLVNFPFRGYLTTNLDSVLTRHFRDIGIAVSEYTNSKTALEQVDFGELHCVVNVHGDLSSVDTVVLTDDQYDEVAYDPKFEHLRTFLRAHLTTSRILFVGYSMRDSDIQFLSKLSVHALRRKTPLYAVVASATEEMCDEWDRKYNIRIIPYRDTDGSHSELKQVFDLLRRYVSLRGEAPPPSSPIPLEVAQSLYMWHRFQLETGKTARKDAFASLVLSVVAGWRKPGEPFGLGALVERVAEVAQMNTLQISKAVESAALQNCGDGLLKQIDKQRFNLTDRGYELNNKYSGLFTALRREFNQQLELDFRKLAPSISAKDIGALHGAVLEAITSTFAQRGAEVVQTVFGREKEVRPTLNLFKIINATAQGLPSNLRYLFIVYVTDLLTNPKGTQERFLEYLAKAFFVIQALGLDPDGNKVRLSLLSNHTLVIDSNVLIPALAINSARHSFVIESLSKAKAAGLNLIVTPRVFDETMSHCFWADNLVRQCGEQSMEVLSAALGRGHYKENAFLDGFIRFYNDVKEVGFDEYLEQCFGGPPRYKTGREKLKSIGVEYFYPDRITSEEQNYFLVREETDGFLEESIIERPNIQKTKGRIEAESEVYAVIYSWDSLRRDDTPGEDWKCSFLTYASFLNKVAYESPYPLNRNIIVRPDVLYEFLGRFEPVGAFSAPFRDVLLSTYFRSADYFIDRAKYARFFSPLLRHAEDIYKGSLERFRRLVSSGLTAESLFELEELERPFAVTSLNAQADESLRSEVNRLSEENYELRKELEKLRSQPTRPKRRKKR